MRNRKIYTVNADLDNGIPKPEEMIKRVKLPVPKEFGGGWVTGCTMEEAVKNLLEKVGAEAAPDIPKVKEVSERWFSIKMGEDRSPCTIANYERLLNKHILPVFGLKRIDRITPEDIQKFFNGLMKLSRSTSVQCKAILKGIFEFADRNGMIGNNPMRFKYEYSRKTGKKVVLQDDDLFSVINQLDKLEGNDYIYACFLCFTALRRGEILGLKWTDIDFEKRTINVQRNVTYPDGKNPPEVKSPKDGSFGVVYLSSELLKRIRPYRLSKGYIIRSSQSGPETPYSRSSFNKMWTRINKAIDLKGATSHSFRHSYATMMNAHCIHIDPKVLQGALRHRTPDLAIKVYTEGNDNKTKIAEAEYDEWLSKQIAT